MDLIKDYDIIIDGTDNFPTRYCVNDACVLQKKPNVYGSIFRFEGMVTVFAPHLNNPDTGDIGPCYRCLYPEPPDPGSVPSCAEGGVLGVICGVIGSLQANEVVKLILGIGSSHDRAIDHLVFTRHGFPHLQDPPRQELPGLRRSSDHHQADRLRAILRRADPRSKIAGRNQAGGGPREVAGSGAGPGPGLWMPRGLPPGYPFKPDWEVTPRDVKSMLDRHEKFMFIDCRNPNEFEITKIDGAKLIPLPEVARRMGELKGHESEKIVVHCKSGARSMQFTQILRQQGFKDVRSMAGGILLWNKDVNPGGPQY